MKDLLTACAIVIAAIIAFGFIRGDEGKDRMRLTIMEERKNVTVVVTVPDADERYHWLKVYGCSADVTENGVLCNQERWYGSHEGEPGKWKQHLVPFRDCPGGTLQFKATVWDKNGNILAQDQTTMLRGF